MPTAIEFNHVSKQYRLGLVSTRLLSHDLQRWWTMNIRGKEDPYLKIGETNDRATKGISDYVWALKDIDFKGDAMILSWAKRAVELYIFARISLAGRRIFRIFTTGYK